MLAFFLPLAFYLLTAVMVYSLPVLVKPSTALFNRKRKTVRYFMYGFVGWFLYVSAISNNGFLNNFDFPPRMALLIVVPILVILFWYSGRNYVKKTLLSVPVHRLIYIQAFRVIVELLIWGAFILGIWPRVVTFEGLNFDVLVGVSALLMGVLAQRKMVTNRVLLMWNYVGLLILAFTVFQFINYYFLGDFVADENSALFMKLPYLFLPAVLMPLAVFYHILSIRQLRNI